MKFLPERRLITSFGDGGFRFGDHSHRGHLLVLPSGMRAWDGADLSAVRAESEEIDFLLIGTGTKFQRMSDGMAAQLRSLGVSGDAMTTSAAVATYNLMLGDKRRVAAAFLAVP
ncbi:MAG: Mth938-like domain-containing protein [Alphaproteobacteria bacterium]|nr:Mth938-like domain-containing protein [Alphaproteobacteria bacterium]